jgi:hypothetical protein
MFTIFLLGFIADPIINLYVEPLETIYATDLWESDAHENWPAQGISSWPEHFLKGLVSLGFLSFIKVFLAMSPWQWGGLRSLGIIGSGGRSTGRSRVSSMSWALILIGVCSFLWVSFSLVYWLTVTDNYQAVYKGVRVWGRRTLQKAGERVMDVPLPDDEDEYNILNPSSKESSEKDK